jgi:hypothetical protein
MLIYTAIIELLIFSAKWYYTAEFIVLLLLN